MAPGHTDGLADGDSRKFEQGAEADEYMDDGDEDEDEEEEDGEPPQDYGEEAQDEEGQGDEEVAPQHGGAHHRNSKARAPTQ